MSEEIRKIEVDQGKEFQIYVHKDKIDKDDVFIQSYQQAAVVVNDLVKATGEYHKQGGSKSESRPDFLNNIIAFCGERGQGKSSAMVTFMNELCKVDLRKSVLGFSEQAKIADFYKMDIIDPSAFEEYQDILEVIVSRMYKTFEKEYRSGDSKMDKYQAKDIISVFQEAYRNIGILRNPKKIQGGDYEFEGDIERLSQLGDSSMLRDTMIKLVEHYLRMVSGANDPKDKFLVIPIDDLDVSISCAYHIAERIRKYLMIPNVIIIMALKSEQLRYCVEMEFTKQLSDLQKTKLDFVRKEAKSMAGKYMDKLIPNGRKVYLPEIKTMSQDRESKVQIIYKSRGNENVNLLCRKALRIVKKDSEGNDLDSLGGVEMDSEDSDLKPLGLEDAILNYIYRKTGIIFVKKEGEQHLIIPNNLRELVSLMAVLGEMKDPNGDNDERFVENLKILKQHFLETWVVNNLNDKYQDMIFEFNQCELYSKNKNICDNVFRLINEFRGDRYWESEEEKIDFSFVCVGASGINSGIVNKSRKGRYFMLADALNALDILDKEILTMQNKYFVFAIKTLYTIEMNLMYRQNQKLQLYDFVGGRIWSFKKQKDMVRNGISRTTLTFKIEKGFQYCYSNMKGNGKKEFCKILKEVLKLPITEQMSSEENNEQIDVKTEQMSSKKNNVQIDVKNEQDALFCYIIFGFMCHFFKKQDMTFEEELKGVPIKSKNSKVLEEARFSLDTFIVSCIDLELQCENISLDRYSNSLVKSKVISQINEYVHELVTIPINVDMIDACYNKCKESKDIKIKAVERDYYDNYVSSINKVFEEINSYLVVEQKQGIDIKLKQLLIGFYCSLIECYKNKYQKSDFVEQVRDKEEVNKKEVISTYNLGNRKTYKVVQESLEEYIKNNPSINEVGRIKKQFDEVKNKVNDAIEKCSKNNLKQDMTDTGKKEIAKEIQKMNDLIKEYNKDMKEE